MSNRVFLGVSVALVAVVLAVHWTRTRLPDTTSAGLKSSQQNSIDSLQRSYYENVKMVSASPGVPQAAAAPPSDVGAPGTTKSLRLHCIRHGTSLHNTKFHEIGTLAYTGEEYYDTPLLAEGAAEADRLGRVWSQWGRGGKEAWEQVAGATVDGTDEKAEGEQAARDEARRNSAEYLGFPSDVSLDDIDVVLVSPLQRTVNTALEIFKWRDPKKPLKLILLDDIKEWSQGTHTPNKRKSVPELKTFFAEMKARVLGDFEKALRTEAESDKGSHKALKAEKEGENGAKELPGLPRPVLPHLAALQAGEPFEPPQIEFVIETRPRVPPADTDDGVTDPTRKGKAGRDQTKVAKELKPAERRAGLHSEDDLMWWPAKEADRKETTDELDVRISNFKAWLREHLLGLNAEGKPADDGTKPVLEEIIGAEEFAKRGRTVPRIAVVGHSGALSQMMYKVIGDEKHALKHCYVYNYEADL